MSSTSPTLGLAAQAVAVLMTANASQKALAVRQMAADWRSGKLQWPGIEVDVPDRPARPSKPELLAPRAMKRRGPGSLAGRTALLHALAHIELNAIDLACDLLARFTSDGDTPLPAAFADDWVKVADEEGKHFLMLEARLRELGAAYGDLPAHDGLWQAAEATSHDFAARLAIVPLVHEARGLDVTPQTVSALERAGDQISARVLQTIYDDEIGHVSAGVTWFSDAAKRRNKDPRELFDASVDAYHTGKLKGPFNEDARREAGLAALLCGT
ncbi:MAG: ferritin-like domain-containing protein [Alphaproteobacteria bacterium]|uniref:ferritin-like domain-containing protein n=1 Tax=Pyruvatibacter sp. HU-CL02332 TaxID=3127650 RepID=UPI002968D633|nr:ferritin-like domain-containing protein [Alphaproteobacteria bacterium]